MYFIEFTRVSKIYRKGFFAKKIAAVIDCSFSVDQGTITGFIGPNGAGKTTSIKMILGLVRPSSGIIRVVGKNPLDPLSRRDIAYISEQPYFYHHLTVLETLRFAAHLHGRLSADINAKCERALEQVGLEGISKRKMKDLSKGMQQRCLMAQALLMDARALVLDEPLSGLDPLGRSLFRAILRRLSEKGVTIFFSTHIVDDIEFLCRNVVALSKGRLEYQGPMNALLEKGYKGADLVAPLPPQSLREECVLRGWEVTDIGDGKVNIFVPVGDDGATCQKLLFQQGLFCLSITKRNTPLEELLYRS